MKVRIFKPHTHAGTRYAPDSDEGLVIELPDDAAAFVIEHADAKPADELPAAKNKPAANDA
jgi:hypothetical protein